MARYIHRKAGRETGARPGAVLALFLLALVGFSVLNIFWPKRDMSDLENRKLAQMPSFSIKALLNGDYFQDFATYMQDQVEVGSGDSAGVDADPSAYTLYVGLRHRF